MRNPKPKPEGDVEKERGRLLVQEGGGQQRGDSKGGKANKQHRKERSTDMGRGEGGKGKKRTREISRLQERGRGRHNNNRRATTRSLGFRFFVCLFCFLKRRG